VSEAALLHRLMIAFSNVGARVFRNSVGVMYQGEAVRATHECKVTLHPGDVVVRKARTVRAGLCVGSSDAIGWRSLVVTPDMVGRRVAIFAAAETKSERGRLTDEQANFLRQVEHAGGIALECRDVDESVERLTKWRGKPCNE
jgi:hypothetical protein